MPILLYPTRTPVHRQLTVVVKGEESCELLLEVLRRGVNTWTRQTGPEGAEIRKLMEALK